MCIIDAEIVDQFLFLDKSDFKRDRENESKQIYLVSKSFKLFKLTQHEHKHDRKQISDIQQSLKSSHVNDLNSNESNATFSTTISKNAINDVDVEKNIKEKITKNIEKKIESNVEIIVTKKIIELHDDEQIDIEHSFENEFEKTFYNL